MSRGLFSDKQLDQMRASYEKGQCVYYYQETGRKDGNRIAIGTSRNGQYSRMSGYKPSSVLRLVAWEPGDDKVEKERLNHFCLHKVKGTMEWFYPRKPLLIHIERLRKKYKKPPRISGSGRRKNGRKLKRRLLARLRKYRPTLVLAVATTVRDWFDRGEEPGSDDASDGSSERYYQARRDVTSRWKSQTGKTEKEFDFLFDDEVIKGCWRRVRRGEWKGRDSGKTKLEMKVEWVMENGGWDLEKDEWL